MDPIDRTLLEFCRDDFCALKPLKAQIPSSTLYRHARRLVRLGWLRTEADLYRTTEAGLRPLAEASSRREWDRLERLYPPLALVPTAVHSALIKLILAAVVCRQHETRPDRHPAFVVFGATLRWKTSLGIFVCHALGLDPGLHIVDCGVEAGKSLSFRRSGTGSIVFKRELLDGAFLTLDELLTAEASVRATLGIFLSGRLVMPFENERLCVRPVPLLTLNPRPKEALEARVGLSAPQIRRAILANLDAIPMPDLATIGERAITAARAERPLSLAAPATDCQTFHRAIVELTRAILIPAAHERVDVEIVVNLSTGMTALIAEPVEAIAQVAHALGILAETMGWAQPGWIDAVSRFTLEPTPHSRQATTQQALALRPKVDVETSGVPGGVPASTRALSLQVPRPGRPDSAVPDLSLSAALRARLIWFAVDTGLALEAALSLLLDFYLKWRHIKATLWTLHTILTLAEQLGVAEVDVETLHGYLKARAELAKYNCSFEDVSEALRVLDLLGELPEAWDWPRAQAAMQGVAALLRAGISADQIDEVLQRHQRLAELGFDEATAEAIAQALSEATGIADRRGAILREMVALASAQLDRADLERECEKLRAEVVAVVTERDRLRRAVKGVKTRLRALEQQEAEGKQRKATIDGQTAAKASELAALRAFRALILRKSTTADAFCADLERLVRYLRAGGRPEDAQGAALMTASLQTLAAFLTQLGLEARATQSGP